jgi:hypothetical protein
MCGGLYRAGLASSHVRAKFGSSPNATAEGAEHAEPDAERKRVGTTDFTDYTDSREVIS